MTDSLAELQSWLESVTGDEWIWYAKYLSANDTYAKKNVHQGGPYLAKDVLRAAFPHLMESAASARNPEAWINARIDSHGYMDDVRVIYYNSRILGDGTRNEARTTQWGGQDVPVVAAESTGALVLFAYHKPAHRDADGCRIWVCESAAEEDLVVERVGAVEPGRGILVFPSGRAPSQTELSLKDRPCSLKDEDIPPAWRGSFPTGEQIVHYVVEALPSTRLMHPDERLLRRRECEYEVFRSVERSVALPRINEGFATVDLFVDFANALTNRRKSRSGKSLELQARRIFDEEGVKYTHGGVTEGKRMPDFVFPAIDAYHDKSRDATGLRMLAAKTTCKDRWRQILNEADRIPEKHLLTLQEGVSSAQHREMREEGVVLVVPEALLKAYPDDVVPYLMPFHAFIQVVRNI